MESPRLKPSSLAQSDWRNQLRSAYTQPMALLDALGLSQGSSQSDWANISKTPFAMRVPQAFVDRMKKGDASDPLLAQILPRSEETHVEPGYISDPVGDHSAKQARGVLHKYQGRALLITTGACAVHCRYCFRQNFPYSHEHLHKGVFDEGLSYIQRETSIEEVILSGGDPLMLSTERLLELTEALAAVPHIKRLRIHTRMPIVLPSRVTQALLGWLASLPWPVAMVIHANHANEFDASVDEALAAVSQTGVRVFNQAVLLRGINDTEEALANLMERGFDAGAIPYYLHRLDRVKGAHRYAVDDDKAKALIEQLRVRLSGYLVPRLVWEKQGAPYKIPLL